LGFCNYYRKFIERWLDKIEPFMRMMKKDELWKWDDNKVKLFREFKEKFIEKLILRIY